MDLLVKMYPHVGTYRHHLGGKEIVQTQDLGQCIVHANGTMVGIYCGKQNEANKFLSFTVPLPETLQSAVAAEVAKLTGGVGTFAAVPPEDHDVPGDSE